MSEQLKKSYLGVLIYRNVRTGMYSALIEGYGFVRADTIDGIKRLIREARRKP